MTVEQLIKELECPKDSVVHVEVEVCHGETGLWEIAAIWNTDIGVEIGLCLNEE